eukprot:763273-Hanusia_phi.AAC.4
MGRGKQILMAGHSNGSAEVRQEQMEEPNLLWDRRRQDRRGGGSAWCTGAGAARGRGRGRERMQTGPRP